MMRFLIPAVLLLAAVMPAKAQEDFSDVEMKVTHVAGTVYMLEGRGGNIGVSVGEDGILIVDDQFAPLADKIRAALAELGDGKLRFVLNTHWHTDHTGGNVEFGPEAPIIAHANVRKRLSERQEIRGRVFEPQPAHALPVVTFEHGVSVHFNGEEIEALHFPAGHTDGDTVVFFKGSNVVHMGDQYFASMFPFVDLDSGGSVQGLTTNIARILERLPEGAKIIPGHGPLSERRHLSAYHEMLVETTALVQQRIDAGRKLVGVQKAGLPGKYETWSSGFISELQWLATIYRSLTGEPPPPPPVSPAR